jgi:hypothetical protein
VSILCWLFGHKPPANYYRHQVGYADQPNAKVWRDGMGRGHVTLRGSCERCGVKHDIIKFHPPKEWITP